MSLREFYESHYALEVGRKTDLTTALSLPVGILSLLVGSLVVMAKELHLPLNVGEQIQLAAIILSGFASVVSGYFLFRSLYNFEYRYAPTPLQIKAYKEKLVAFHQSSGVLSKDANELAEAETLDYIDGEYAINTDRNATNNDIKSAFLHSANGSIIAALLLAAVAAVTYVVNAVSSPRPVQRVEIMNPREVSAMHGNTPVQAVTAPSPSTQTPAPPPPAQPVRPEPPPSRVIKEDRHPPKPPPLRK